MNTSHFCTDNTLYNTLFFRKRQSWFFWPAKTWNGNCLLLLKALRMVPATFKMQQQQPAIRQTPLCTQSLENETDYIPADWSNSSTNISFSKLLVQLCCIRPLSKEPQLSFSCMSEKPMILIEDVRPCACWWGEGNVRPSLGLWALYIQTALLLFRRAPLYWLNISCLLTAGFKVV